MAMRELNPSAIRPNNEKEISMFLRLIVVWWLVVRISSHDKDINAFCLKRQRNGVFDLDLVTRRKQLRIIQRGQF
jgi:hypothetical protein